MLLISPNKLKHRDNELLARTGVTKAGYLLKRQPLSAVSSQSRWESTFLILNDHALSYCSEKNSFTRSDGNLLLTTSTRVYNQQGEEAVIRIETGFEVLFLKGRDVADTKDWMKAINKAINRLPELSRGMFAVKKNGKVVTNQFLMLHRECITSHPSYNQSSVIEKVYPVTSETSYTVDERSIKIKDLDLTLIAKNDVELKNFAYALGQTISSLQNGSKLIINPPQLPLYSGTLLSLDISTMKWMKKYLVLTGDRIYIHGHKRVGFNAAQELRLTPNTMIFSTTLKPYSFEIVLFSESLHLAADCETDRSEWLSMIHQLTPKCTYDMNDPLQAASFERELNDYPIEFQSTKEPGVILERRGNWAIATVVSESLSRKISQGSMLSKIEGQPVVLNGFDSVASMLSMWRSPLRLSFWLSPQKMGWLTMMTSENRKSWWRNTSKVVSWESVYVTVSTGVLTCYTNLKDGKSKKHEIGLYGSGVGLVMPELTSGIKNCFRVVNGLEEITFQAASQEDMMDWSTTIVHGISMENGGGLLLDKAKKEHIPNSTAGQCHQSSVFRGTRSSDDGVKSSIIFSKQLEEAPREEPSIVTKSKSLDSMVSMPLAGKLGLKQSHSSDEINHLTFKTLDPVDLSETMQTFASNFFIDTQKTFPTRNHKASLPVQAQRVQDLSYDSIESICQSTTDGSECLDIPWLELDKASSVAALSDDEIVDKHLDLNASDTHLDAQGFKTLLKYNEERRV